MGPSQPPTNTRDGGLRARLVRYLVTRCDPPQVVASGTSSPDTPASTAQDGRQFITMNIDVLQLLDACCELADPLLSNNTLGTLEMLKSEVLNLFQLHAPGISVKAPSRQMDVSLRLTHMPPTSLGGLGGSSLKQCSGCLVSLTGTMVRVTGKRVVPSSSIYRCGKCGNNSTVSSDPFHRGDTKKPRCEEKSCKGEVLQLITQTWMDYAECRLQQRLETTGRMPRSVLVALDDELTTKCTVGQLVEVVGVVRERWKNVFANGVPSIEMVVWALNIHAVDASRHASTREGDADASTFRPELVATQYNILGKETAAAESKLRSHLLQSTCPQLSGVFGPRLGLLLAAVDGAWRHGGSSTDAAAPTTAASSALRVRATIHMLLVGDPSTGKSQLLRYAAMIAPRSTSTTGVTTTSAGLTVAATKEMGEWVLEPGALVLSDGGTCCIDELRTVSAADRTSLHEAMEQQTISVAKAGLVTRLRTVCSVISACNPPMNRRNPYGHLNVEIGVGGPLLSRFDMIFLMWDEAGGARDMDVASHILECSAAPPIPPFSVSHIARYLAFLRAHYTTTKGPALDEDAARLIGQYFECLRRRGSTPALCDAVPVTVRLLESLIRCAQAHGKLVQHAACNWRDACMSIFLMERTAYALKFDLPVTDHHLVASVKAALHVEDDKDLFSSSKWLDEVFLSDLDDAVRLQECILAAVRDRYGGDSLPASQGQSDEGYHHEPLLGDTVELLTMVTGAVGSPTSDTSRKRSRSPLSSALHRRSSSAVSFDASPPSLTERSVAAYDSRAFSPPALGAFGSQRHTIQPSPALPAEVEEEIDVLEFPEDDVAPPSNTRSALTSSTAASHAPTPPAHRTMLSATQPVAPAPSTKRTPAEILKQLAFKGFGAR
jgi:DNA replicative helicase MCM subunit Mcm2 (Cdc46/Mcm family)